MPEHSDKLVKTLFIVAECLEEAAKQPKSVPPKKPSVTQSAKKSSKKKKHKRSSSRDSTSSKESTHSRTRSHPQVSSLYSPGGDDSSLTPPPDGSSPARASSPLRTRQSPDGSVASSSRSGRRPPSSFAGLTSDLKPHNTTVAANIRQKLAITLPKTSEGMSH